jgi:serine/threonine protein kinase
MYEKDTETHSISKYPAISTRYVIDDVIGSGGMGQVFSGRDTKLGRKVALKIAPNGGDLSRQIREAQALAKINSSNVVQVFDIEEMDEGQTLIVMELVEGADLTDKIKINNFTQLEALSWMTDVCAGMESAASQGIVHRDLKPANIMIDGNGTAKVLDFGLASCDNWCQITLENQMLGTPCYIAPEQIDDTNGVDLRADIYSYGATFYHVLTGRPPFTGDSIYSLLMKHKHEPIVAPKSLNSDIPPYVNDCLERCLAKNPLDRFRTFRDILDVLNLCSKSDPWSPSEDSELTAFEAVYRLHRPALLNRTEPVERTSPVVFDFPGQRRLIIEFGDITKMPVDAVVSSDNSTLSMRGAGVAAALLKRAGPKINNLCALLQPAQPGCVVVTPGFDLPAKYVFHGITIGYNRRRFTFPSRDVIAKIVDACFANADTYNIRTIAFPLLATGGARIPRDIALDTMFRTIARRFLGGACSLQTVSIVLL